MSYDENRISDLIDRGLSSQQESIRIDYALYGNISDTNPLVRFKTLKEARDEYLSSTEYSMVITEVSEIRNGKIVITQERVVKSPQIWLPANRFVPEFDGDYLCHIVIKNQCGSFVKKQDVITYSYSKWQTTSEARVTHWMIVEDPVSKLKLLDQTP